MFSSVLLPFSQAKKRGNEKKGRKLSSATTYAYLPVGDFQNYDLCVLATILNITVGFVKVLLFFWKSVILPHK